MRDAAFPTGIVLFFRTMLKDESLARSIHPRGRNVRLGGMDSHEDDYIVVDENNDILGCYPRDFVAAILPLETIGPGAPIDANYPPSQSPNRR